MSKAPSHVTTTTNTSPWSGQQPYLTQGFQGAQDLLRAGGPQYYPNQTYAQPNNYQYGGLQSLADIGLSGTPVQNAASNTAQTMLDPNWLQANPGNPTYNQAAGGGFNAYGGMWPESLISSGMLANRGGQPTLDWFASGQGASAENPFFGNMVNSTVAHVLPQIQGQFNMGNRLDSGLASRAVGEGLGDAIGGLAYNNYQTGLGQALSAAGQLGQFGQGNIANQLSASNLLNQQQQQNAALQLAGASGQSQNFNTAAENQVRQTALAPEISNLAYQQAGALTDSGSQLQQLQQQAINDAVQRWQYNQQLPYSNLANYMNLIQGNYGSQGSTTSPYFQNQGANILGGALGLAGLGNTLGLFGGAAAAVPDAFGVLGPLLGLI